MTPQLDRFPIEKKLGEGGMGTVWLAYDKKLDRRVALKSLNLYLAQRDPLVRDRFISEAKTVAKLQHNNIVTLYDYLDPEVSDGFYLVMEFVHGKPLDDVLNERKFSATEAISIFVKILDAFAYAHKQGIVHRDIKPSNIMITDDGDAKVLDFGIAKLASKNDQQTPDSGKLTKTGTRLGTLLYMSPEQVRGREVDARTDIYALGVTFLQMLTGEYPYDMNTLSDFDISLKIVSEPLISNNLDKVPAPIIPVLAKATEKEKENRFQTCDEFKAALLAAVESLGATDVTGATTKTKPITELNNNNKNVSEILNNQKIKEEAPAVLNKVVVEEKNIQKKRKSPVGILIIILLLAGISGIIAVTAVISTESSDGEGKFFEHIIRQDSLLVDSITKLLTDIKDNSNGLSTDTKETNNKNKITKIDTRKTKDKNPKTSTESPPTETSKNDKDSVKITDKPKPPTDAFKKDLRAQATYEKKLFGKNQTKVFITNLGNYEYKDLKIKLEYYKDSKLEDVQEIERPELIGGNGGTASYVHEYNPKGSPNQVKVTILRASVWH
jgi:serine/threonine protein kinase